MAGETPAKKPCTSSPMGYFHRDSAEVRPEEGQLSLLVAIDRAGKFAYAEWQAEANNLVAAQFLRNWMAAVPYKIHTVLTDHGSQFTNRKRAIYAFQHIWARVCHAYGIDHRLTTTNHPWTNGPVARMNRTLNDATVKTYHDQTHHDLKAHLQAFLLAYNVAKRRKTLKGLTPDEYICRCWQQEPQRFPMNPHHHTLGLNS
jgi:hypothetical protein